MSAGFGRKGLAAGSTGAMPPSFGAARAMSAGRFAEDDAQPGHQHDAQGEEHLSPQMRAFLAAERANRPQSTDAGVSDIAAAMPRSRGASGGVGGKPRSMMLAYVLWYFGGAIAAHRFYLGVTQSAIIMLGLFWGGLLMMLVLPPLGLVGIGAWFLWNVADLFLIPGLVRRSNEPAIDHGEVFA